MTNTAPIVVPTRAKSPAVGTNALTFSAPGKDGDSFVLDAATSAVAYGKLEMQAVKNEPLPDGWACGPNGSVTNDPKVGMVSGLMPLGGAEVTSGYKGYGIGVMVEILSSILAGSSYGPWVKNWKFTKEPVCLGQMFLAIDPTVFADGFQDRLQQLLNCYREMEPVSRIFHLLM